MRKYLEQVLPLYHHLCILAGVHRIRFFKKLFRSNNYYLNIKNFYNNIFKILIFLLTEDCNISILTCLLLFSIYGDELNMPINTK